MTKKTGGLDLSVPHEYINDSLIVNGDCLEVMQSMPDKSIDMVLTDPP